MYVLTNPNLAWNFLESNLLDILKVDAPVITCHQGLKQQCLRDAARNVSKITNSEEDKMIYRRLRNKATMEVRKDRQDFFRKQYNDCEYSNDSSKLYKTTKIQAGWKTNGPPVSLVINGQNITSPKIIAQEQMKFFQKKNEKLLESVEGSDEINPLEILKHSVKKWTDRKTDTQIIPDRSISRNSHKTHQQSERIKCMGTG